MKRTRPDHPPRAKKKGESRFKPAPRPDSLQDIMRERTELDGDMWIRHTLTGRIQEIAPDEDSVPLSTNLYMTNELPAEGPIEVVVSFHGQGSVSGTNKDIFTSLHHADMPVIAPTTSRRTRFSGEVREQYDNDRGKWIRESFAGKEFADEMEDFRRGIEVGLAEFKQQLEDRGMGDREVRLVFMGHSYGGTIAAQLAGEYKPAHLVLLAPSLRMLERTPEEEPIMGENPPTPAEVLQNAHQAGEVTVIRGANDTLISHEDAMAYGGATGTVIELDGVGHLFGKYDNPDLGDVQDESKRNLMRDAVVQAIIQPDETGTPYPSDAVPESSW